MKKMNVAIALAAPLLFLAACSVYDNYDMDLMQDATASVESSAVVSPEEKSSSSEKNAESSSSEKVASESSSSKNEETASSSSKEEVKISSSSESEKVSSSSKEPEESSSSVAGFICGDSVFTRGGVEYKTIKVNKTCWMAENLKYKTIENNTHICYGNDDANCETYGRLYSIDAAKEACQIGKWRLPTETDLENLLAYLKKDMVDAGRELKSSTLWNPEADGLEGLNSIGFNALPGGKYDGEDFMGLNNLGYWWTSEKNSTSSYYVLKLSASDDGFYPDKDNSDEDYLSVRCVLDL